MMGAEENSRGNSGKTDIVKSGIGQNPDLSKKRISEESKRKLAAYIEMHNKGIYIKMILRDSLKVIRFLNSRGIDYAVLKGISLWYFDRARQFGDIDIFVSRSDAKKVAELLIQEFGYDYERMGELAFVEKDEIRNAHDISMISPGATPVEIHYRLFNYAPDYGIYPLRNKVCLEIDGVRVPCPQKELQLLEVLLHNAYNHMFICDMKKWVRDINIIIDNYDIDWDGFIELLAASKQTELAYLTVRFLDFQAKPGTKVHPSVMARLRPHSFLSYLKKPVFMWACYFVWDRLFPPAFILQERFNISPCSKLFFLCYPANWIRLPIALAQMLLKR
ncbi:MAG: nucleotidyltransferase family protein [Candidatus Micrarchaeota archaeon]|nr:nucleotidyltransferase family protein [Candidatus Micrarchaeota archaeon]